MTNTTTTRFKTLSGLWLSTLIACGSGEPETDGGTGGGGNAGGNETGGAHSGSGAAGGAAAGSGATGSGAASTGGGATGSGAPGGTPGTGGMAGSGSAGTPSAPDLLDSLLADLPTIDCGLENPCVLDGSCEGDTNPCRGNYTIETASDLETIRDCTSVEGDLDVSAPELESLGTLALRAVGGSVVIHGNDALLSLEGLESLVSIGSFAVIGRYETTGGNPKLTNLHGLEGLRYVHSGLSIDHADSLTSLDGLNFGSSAPSLNVNNNPLLSDLGALSTLECGSLSLSENASLTSLSALENFKQVGSLALFDNPALSDISSLQGVTTIASGLNVSNCPLLDSLDVFSQLETVGSLWIGDLPQIHDFQDFQNLTKIAGDLAVSQTGTEMTFGGLEQLEVIGRDLHIWSGSIGGFEGLGSVRAIGGAILVGEDVPVDDFSGLTSLRSLGVLETEELALDLHGLEQLEFVGALSFTGDEALDVPSRLPSLSAAGTLDVQETSVTDLNLFGGLVVKDGLRVANNPSLGSLTGVTVDEEFESTSIGLYFGDGFEGSVELTENPLLSDISALSGLVKVGGFLQVVACGVSSLSGLEDLTEVGDYPLRIANNESLRNLDGLVSVSSVVGSVEISDNPVLESIAGLQSLSSIVPLDGLGLPNLLVEASPLVPSCSVQGIFDGLQNSNSLSLSVDGTDDNATCP